jgi:putative transposase
VPVKITIDKSGANTAAIESVKADACVDILMRHNKYLNNVVEQDQLLIRSDDVSIPVRFELVETLRQAQGERFIVYKARSIAIKRITQPIHGFKSFWSARIIIAGI